VSLQPDIALSKLGVQRRTPTPTALVDAPWAAHTPSNIRELEAQSTLISERVRKHKGSSPASIIDAISQLKKGAQVTILTAQEKAYTTSKSAERGLARIYSLNVRLISRLLVRSVREDSNQVSAVSLSRAVQGAESVVTTHVRV
jgi:hypothetical protein